MLTLLNISVRRHRSFIMKKSFYWPSSPCFESPLWALTFIQWTKSDLSVAQMMIGFGNSTIYVLSGKYYLAFKGRWGAKLYQVIRRLGLSETSFFLEFMEIFWGFLQLCAGIRDSKRAPQKWCIRCRLYYLRTLIIFRRGYFIWTWIGSSMPISIIFTEIHEEKGTRVLRTLSRRNVLQIKYK